MSQITLYLDDETAALVAARARASGLSKSRWVAEIICRYASYGLLRLPGRRVSAGCKPWSTCCALWRFSAGAERIVGA